MYSGIDRYIVLYSAAIPKDDTGRNNYILPQRTILAKGSPLHNVGEMPNNGAATNGATFVYNGCGVSLIVCCGYVHKAMSISFYANCWMAAIT